MRIHFNGAAQTVTGSQYLLEVNGSRILMECGLYQGRRAETYERNRTFHFDPKTIDAVLLSHAHIDHSGNLPNLVKQEYAGPIFATSATADLADAMLQDSGHIQEADAEFVNKRNLERGEPPVEPLYTLEDAKKVAEHFRPQNYFKPVEVAPGVSVEFIEAGHILGSAAIRLEIHEGSQTKRFWFSGDIGRYKLPILRDPVMPHDADYLMMECTYGDKPHADPLEAHREFHAVVLQTLKRGGKVIIPAFAVGRTQELVFSLNQLVETGQLKHIPVFVDSPLALHATQVFDKHPECYDAETLAFIRSGKHPALAFAGLKYVQTVEESKAINSMKGPMIIIAASGMAEAGRILHHLKNNIEDEKNTILIVGWQAPYTLGRRLADREPVVKIYGEEYHRKADVVTIGGLSAHAGQDLLTQYALSLKGQAKQVILVHGETDAATAFQARLRENGMDGLLYPELYSSLEI
ncbi:MAG TPA: MBL fold metallo-hydrolase [Anaerolineales bacterium]|nr:MBL fold metallo-hydrolase [Anaerolineales bacterium]